MTYDVTNGIINFFRIFGILTDWLKNTEFIIGSVTFTLWGLMWSIILFSIFVSFLFKILGGE